MRPSTPSKAHPDDRQKLESKPPEKGQQIQGIEYNNKSIFFLLDTAI